MFIVSSHMYQPHITCAASVIVVVAAVAEKFKIKIYYISIVL